MSSLNSVFRPELPEGRAQEGKIMGWLPGEIISLNDPEKHGRVQVRCDMIAKDVVWPNANDGWCWVLEDYTLPTETGGAHKMLKVGSQVAMVPMMGDPRQMLIIGCIHSRRDMPSPHTDRFNETYGAVSAGGVVEVSDDREKSHGKVFPHGVFQHVSGDGNLTMQTRDHARMQLQQDGNLRFENDKCFSALSPDGIVQQGNDSGAFTRLDPDGDIAIKSPSGCGMTLGELDVVATGPASGVSKIVKQGRKLFGGRLGESVRSLRELRGILRTLGPQDFVANAPRIFQLLNQVSSLQDNIKEGMSIIDKITSYTPEDLAKAIAPQVDVCLDLNLEELLPDIEGILGDVVISEQSSSLSIADAIKDILPDKLKERVRPELIEKIAKVFSYDKELAAKAILHEVVPMGTTAIANIFGLNLQKNLGGLSEAIEGVRSLKDLATTPGTFLIGSIPFADQLVGLIGGLIGKLPGKITKFLPMPLLEEILAIPEASDFSPLQLMIGHVTGGVAKDAKTSLEKVTPSLSKLKPLREMFRQNELYEGDLTGDFLDKVKEMGLAEGLDWSKVTYDDMPQFLKAIALPVIDELEPALEESVGHFNGLIESLPDDLASVRLSLGESSGTITAKGLGLGGCLEVTPDGGEIIGPDTFTKLSVENGKAKIGSILGALVIEEKGLKAGAEVLDFLQVSLDKFDVVIGMIEGFQVKIGIGGISIGMNGIPKLPDLSRLAKELIGSEKIAQVTEAISRIKQAVEGDGGGEEVGGGSSGGGSGGGSSSGTGLVSLNLNEKGITAGSENGPQINILDDRVGIAGTDYLPFVQHTHSVLNHTIGTLDLTDDTVIAFHFPWVTEEYGSNWREYVRENFPRAEEVIAYLSPLEGNAGRYLAELIYRRMDRPLHDWTEFGFENESIMEEDD